MFVFIFYFFGILLFCRIVIVMKLMMNERINE